MPSEVTADSSKTLTWSTRLVQAYTNPDKDARAEVEAVLNEVGRDKSELRDLVASLTGLAAHAVLIMSEDSKWTDPVLFPWQRRAKALHQLVEVKEASSASAYRSHAGAVADSLPATVAERRSGFDRRLTPDRRFRSPGNPVEQIHLRHTGERRGEVADRRSGVERRRAYR